MCRRSDAGASSPQSCTKVCIYTAHEMRTLRKKPEKPNPLGPQRQPRNSRPPRVRKPTHTTRNKEAAETKAKGRRDPAGIRGGRPKAGRGDKGHDHEDDGRANINNILAPFPGTVLDPFSRFIPTPALVLCPALPATRSCSHNPSPARPGLPVPRELPRSLPLDLHVHAVLTAHSSEIRRSGPAVQMPLLIASETRLPRLSDHPPCCAHVQL